MTTFGSFNNIAKLNSGTVRTWADLLQRLPQSRLIIKWKTLEMAEIRRHVLEQFLACGIDAARLDLRGFSSHAAMLAEYGEVDIALDPFPFSGGITSCEALWMGVPVVTLRGDRPSGRQTAAFLTVLGLNDLVAESTEEYVTVAESLANNMDRLRGLRGTLRERMATSPLCDGRRFTGNLEGLYREMWRAWCCGSM